MDVHVFFLNERLRDHWPRDVQLELLDGRKFFHEVVQYCLRLEGRGGRKEVCAELEVVVVVVVVVLVVVAMLVTQVVLVVLVVILVVLVGLLVLVV